MMISFTYFDSQIKFEDDKIPVLIIENKQLFRNVLYSFLNESHDEYFTFSENFKPFEFNKQGFFISNPIELDLNNKKLITKINSYLSNTVNNEFLPELSNVHQSIYDLADKLVAYSSFDLLYENIEIDSSDIVKLLSFKINCEEQTLAENLISFILLLHSYLKINIIVVANFYVYFSPEEAEQIFKTLTLNHINILLIEQSLPSHISAFESLHILDNDLCELTNE